MPEKVYVDIWRNTKRVKIREEVLCGLDPLLEICSNGKQWWGVTSDKEMMLLIYEAIGDFLAEEIDKQNSEE